MTENGRRFLRELGTNSTMQFEVNAVIKFGTEAVSQQIAAIAEKFGFAVTPEDFMIDAEPLELSDDELSAVAGG